MNCSASRCCWAARDAGQLFALRDICPHRAAPLSAGRFHREASGAETVECPYHGWRFGADGACAAIPSLVADQEMDVGRIRVRRYPVAESQGLVFVWVGSDPRAGEPDRAAAGLRGRGRRRRRSWSTAWTSTPTSTTRWWA